MQLLIISEFEAADVLIDSEAAARLIADYRCPDCLVNPYVNRSGNVVINHVRELACPVETGLVQDGPGLIRAESV